MHIIRTGKTSIVIVFPRLGFVLKVARIDKFRIRRIFRYIRMLFTEPKSKNFSSKFAQLNFRLDNFAIGGIYANIRERRLWKRTKNPFLLPTWFSLFGVMNICPYAKNVLTREQYNSSKFPLQLDIFSELWSQVEGHTFARATNFCVDDLGKVKLIDYGFKHCEKVIRHCGQGLYDNLNPYKVFTPEELDKFHKNISACWKDWTIAVAKDRHLNSW